MAEGTRHPVGIARVVLVEIVRHPAGEPGLRIADMSGTLARLLVIGFALSYGCSVLRSLISRQRCRVRQQARESSR